MTISRRDTRMLLLQMLYADVFVKNLDISLWCESYHDELHTQNIDMKLLQNIRETIHRHSSELLAIIAVLAPKFSLEELPKIHIIILLIALAEMQYFAHEIPEKVSVNEAIELAKTFSDESGAKFINGTLGNFVRDKEQYNNTSTINFSFFL